MKILFLIISLFSLNAWPKVNFELVLESSKVKQGEIVLGRMILNQSEDQKELSGLNGLNLDNTIYLMNISPFIGKNGSYEAEVKVIFLKVPEVAFLKELINGEEVIIQWTPVEIVPTEDPQSFILGDFNIPSKEKYGKWIIGVFAFILSFIIIFILVRIKKKRKNERKLRKKIKNNIVNCKSYEEIVLMWRQKQFFLDSFPKLDKEFKSFERVLFKYQFKPTQTSSEVEAVNKAYSLFRSNVLGILNGI